MSGLAGLYVVPQTPDEWRQWSFVHVAHHRDVSRLLMANYGVASPGFALDPLPGTMPDDTWLLANQSLHVIMDAVLGINAYNLEQVDFNDPGQLATWINNHGQEHYQAAQKLGIG